ncbi:MAG TPA: DUF2817 domain-containing protein [Leeuwenhoekiella sp.]|nr:DUF2817 domain-containing protein [Leeuwenhoekiella sp.]
MDYYNLKQWHAQHKETALSGRYINQTHLLPALEKYSAHFEIKELGTSVEGKTIHSIEAGHGPVKVLAWSQMHGNESTTTKAVFDLLHFLSTDKGKATELLEKITLCIIPMLNPDGAAYYTRLNANKVDLNRDAQALTQPESKILKQVYMDFKPDFALNLHGQRTLFGVGEPPRSATVSLLSPAQDEDRTVTPARKRGMDVIVAIHRMLQAFIPQAVGRYDDSYNLNCVGDTLQSLDIPTILFEAGHFSGDYNREQTRTFIFLALLQALEKVADRDDIVNFDPETYFAIPENKKCFYDYIIRNVNLPKKSITDIAVHFEEKIDQNGVKFVPKIEKIGNLSDYKGHQEYDFKDKKPAESLNYQWKEGVILTNLKADGDFTITFSVN